MVCRVVVIATKEEEKLIPLLNLDEPYEVIITGVGGTNVIRTLASLPSDTEVVNVGYAGSLDIPIGTMVEVGNSRLYHAKCDYDEPVFSLSGSVKCYTSCDFVTSASRKGCVFDMELAFICAMGFNVRAFKVVSDNLNYKEYESIRDNPQ